MDSDMDFGEGKKLGRRCTLMNADKTRREFNRMAAVVAACASPVWPWTPGDLTGAQSLRAHAEQRGLLVGCAVIPEKLQSDPEYASLVAAQANLLVAENAMKWKALRPAPDRFDFSGADQIMDFAAQHGQRVRGHNLCWHKALPDWFGVITKQNARQILTQHIQTVAGRYAGRMQSWDVVNEAIDLKDRRSDGLRQMPWLDLIGPDYIDLAFHTARQADASALLTYNESGIQHDTPAQSNKRDQVLSLLRRLQKRGVPIDAVGIESHLSIPGPQAGSGVRGFVRDLKRMGLQVFLTELDVNEQQLAGSDAQRDTAIARAYTEYLFMMLAEPNVTAVVTWGITDRYTALNKDKFERRDGKPQRPLPFDEDYQPTPAFFALRDAVDRRVPPGQSER
jgi:endo-1,4-beta-xylanase